MNDERVAYVVRQLERGVSAERLHQTLLDAGYTETRIAELLEKAEIQLFGTTESEDVTTEFPSETTNQPSPGFSIEDLKKPERLVQYLPAVVVFILFLIAAWWYFKDGLNVATLSAV